MIVGLIFPQQFTNISYYVMWFTRRNGGNCFRFNKAQNLVDICLKIIDTLAPENEEMKQKIKDKIIELFLAAYGAKPNTYVKDFREFFVQFDIDPEHEKKLFK